MFELYLVDCETTGLDAIKNDPIEISIYRLSNDVQKTWCLKPINMDNISTDALRVNGHKIEDLKGLTQEGRDKYKNPNKVLIEIENWIMEDFMSADDRVLVGQNVGFDKDMLYRLWEKCGSSGTFPFNTKYEIDTMQIEFLISYCVGEMDLKSFSLNALTKKYGIKNERAHSAEADVRATKEVFYKQMEFLKEKLKNE